MSKLKMIIALAGLLLIMLVGSFPPHMASNGATNVAVPGRQFIFLLDGYVPNLSQLAVEWVLIVSGTGGAMILHSLFNRTSERMRLGLCIKCGYDLRATPDRCPECGTVASKDEG